MSVSKWAYDPRYCDGGGCPGDCDLCDKPKNMEDEQTDYIKREGALRAFNGSYSTVDADDILRHLHKSIDVIKNIPSADVVEVVRCKECKHRDTNECPYDTVNYMLADSDFCSSGEREEA